ncbi:MAG TPA: hypothetical protein PLM56_07410 [Cyclobacteriaceae bacterium]|jgi:hypothetical protein|nr:hypothetical protein [Cytophagales bacterium]HMR57436.1 hypothetical protein [Cyclobacteriaceae bacterium]HNT50561.1 hypothetical protein [Cyclobacteriaceae bacterium]HRE67584.1 hypothetical protein [Cyclobacteriaceae bacterium]HRF33309.1 hypothetical protein [Cyclobacteriaceae bacterium]
MKSILIAILLIPAISWSQTTEHSKRWEISTVLSYGSENDLGNGGFMLRNDYEYLFHKTISASVRVGFFHSHPSRFNNEPFKRTFSGLTGGLYLNHTAIFNSERNFVKASAGLAYFNTRSLYQDGNPLDVRTHVDVASKLGYGLSLEGGGRLSEKVALGLALDVYSYYIFGDITVIGANLHFKL